MVGAGKFGVAVATWLAVAAGGCGWDIDIDLTPQSFKLDFGQQTGTVPAIPCNADTVDQVCGATPSVTVDTSSATTGAPSQVDLALGCDASGMCFAEASARVAQSVGVLQDNDFSTRLERHALGLVKLADIGYTVPANSMTIDIPKIDVYAGPAGSTRETDAGVAIVGSTQPIAAAAVITDRQHLIIDDNSPARPVIEHAIENKQDFVFIVVAKPVMTAGSPIPAGAVQVDIYPHIKVGF